MTNASTGLQPYCATCKHAFPPALNPTLQGRRFECPCGHTSAEPHIAAVGRIARWQDMQVRLVAWHRRSRLGPAGRLLLESATVGLALLLARPESTWERWIVLTITVVPAILIILDQLLYNAAVVFTVARPRNSLRTIILGLWGVLVFCGAFATLDRVADNEFPDPLKTPQSGFSEPLQASTALYFSAVTFATVGYGDLHPVTVPARILVTVQIVFGIFLLIVVFANFAMWATSGSPRLPTLSEIKAESEKLDADAATYGQCLRPPSSSSG